MRLVQKVAIVTGAASGFGAGIARCFGAEGAAVVVADRDAEGGRNTAREIEQAGGTTAFFEVDVCAPDQVKAMVDFAVERFGRLDVQVNNAGVGQRPVPLEETSDSVFDALVETNMRSVFLGCRYALPVLRRQGGGVIINTASAIALAPRPNLVAYAASKGWVVTFTKGLALELAPEGIRVNALCPAAGDTPMLKEFMGGKDTAEGRERFAASLPMGRLIHPENVGWAAVYLACDEASMVTGACLPVDGGRCI